MKRRVVIYGTLGLMLTASVVLLVLSRQRLGNNLRHLVATAAERHDLPAALVEAVVLSESGGDPEAVSRAKAYGLMQLRKETAEWLAERPLEIRELMEPKLNLDLGCRYLRQMWDRFSDLRLALMAYNAGPTAVARWMREHPGLKPPELLQRAAYGETRHYVKRVMTRYRNLSASS